MFLHVIQSLFTSENQSYFSLRKKVIPCSLIPKRRSKVNGRYMFLNLMQHQYIYTVSPCFYDGTFHVDSYRRMLSTIGLSLVKKSSSILPGFLLKLQRQLIGSHFRQIQIQLKNDSNDFIGVVQLCAYQKLLFQEKQKLEDKIFNKKYLEKVKKKISTGFYKLQAQKQSKHIFYNLSMSKLIRQKSQIIDDDSEFRIQELEMLAKETNRLDQKKYQILSIIGSQSSGKSTLLNALFGTDFDVLNRRQRVGQTTKGIWFSVQSASNIVILDVEGSDSNQRQERTKIERRNSLFAFAISHTLLINIWIQQIGTFKGAQLQILEVILELNLKLFGSEKPKQIIFVVRDFVQKKENPQALKEKLIEKVNDAWGKIPKPADRAHVRLADVFQLHVFFLPSKLQERQKLNWERGIGQLKKFLVDSTTNQDLIKDNIPVNDLPQYMQNIWTTIESDKDINLPQQKVLLSSMRCQEIKKKAYETYVDEFRDEIEKSERAFNMEFAANIRSIVDKMFSDYDRETIGYIEAEVDKARNELEKELSDKIEESFLKQSNLVADDCFREFLDSAGKIFSKQKNLEEIKDLKPKTLQNFSNNIKYIAYKQQWGKTRIQKFQVQLQKKFESQKEKIVNDTVKEFNRILKKQMENSASNAFYDRVIFTEKFWSHLNEELKKVSFKSKNSIQNVYNKLQIGGKKEVRQAKIKALCDKAQEFAELQLKNFIKMKCIDLKYFLMKHFTNQFSNDGEVPRQWPSLKEEEIKALFEEKKRKYINLIDSFTDFRLGIKERPQSVEVTNQRHQSLILSQSADDETEILSIGQQRQLKKKLEEEMNKQLEQALRKNKETYSASIPTWALALLGIAAIDDVLLWFSSPVIALPLTLILVAVILAFVFGGKTLTERLLSTFKSVTEGAVANVTRTAASSLLKKN